MLFFLQAEDGIRDGRVTGVQTCALPISPSEPATTAADVAGSLGVAVADVDFALGALEHEGFVRSEERRVGKECTSLVTAGLTGTEPNCPCRPKRAHFRSL